MAQSTWGITLAGWPALRHWLIGARLTGLKMADAVVFCSHASGLCCRMWMDPQVRLSLNLISYLIYFCFSLTITLTENTVLALLCSALLYFTIDEPAYARNSLFQGRLKSFRLIIYFSPDFIIFLNADVIQLVLEVVPEILWFNLPML